MPESNVSEQFNTLGCCVIIPTYNNAGTLEDLVRKVLTYTGNVIVINDGSTDGTRSVLQKFPQIITISLTRNKGKGFAIRTGFREALKKGYRYAITIDSDGQHSPDDLPGFIEKIEAEPESLIIGARNLDQDGVPGGTTFGNRFSNFWTWVETGYKLPDTQSGYRLYPIKKLEKTRFITRRFEFEIEVLVRSAWKGIPIVTVPVSVVYPPKKVRVSHFRPITDFARISLLNTFLTLITLFIVWPFLFVRNLNRENIQKFIRNELFNPKESNLTKALSVAHGIFWGIAPVWGWQTAVSIFLAFVFRLNKMITLVAVNISIPPIIPLILWGSYKTGGLLLNKHADLLFSRNITFEVLRDNLFQYILGAFVLAAAMALVSGLSTYIVLLVFRRKRTGVVNPENSTEQNHSG
ncbi:MAG: DUF2062 domain-containing protein [Bacteroidales bacterium]|nr:DUF2062 domain-containing protein [Bacteroidales bacterium]